ncbi:ABC transporter permease [Rhizobium leguminosarum]|uniref:ABC transporter permease n=1 Tax=Rhizobium leguminosarum TaxID=384 RepID=UPI003F99FB88
MIFSQTFSLIGIVLRTIPHRLGAALSTVVSTGCAVGVLIATLAFATGLYQTIRNTGREDRVIVLSKGANSEIGSFLDRRAVAQIREAPGIARTLDNNQPLASADGLILVALEQSDNKGTANATVRGVDWPIFSQMEDLRLTAGRPLEPGKHELIVGKAVQATFVGLNIGDNIKLGNSDWKVVGTFTSGSDYHESEILTDAEGLLAAYRQPAFQSVTAKLLSYDTLSVLTRALDSNPSLNVNVMRETDYYAGLSKPVSGVVFIVAYVIGGIMCVGAIFSAVNSMYIAIDSRSSEITTLRAIGFGRFVVVASTIFESWILSVAGGLIGIIAAALIFEGRIISTIGNGSVNASSIAIVVSITPELFASGLIVATVIGLVGGFIPSILAVRRPLSKAIRGS